MEGSGTRWYRTLFIEEVGKEYIKTARSKGLSEASIMMNHVLRKCFNTNSYWCRSTFTITISWKLNSRTFWNTWTRELHNRRTKGRFCDSPLNGFFRTVLYIIGLILTDISYTIVDPRVRL